MSNKMLIRKLGMQKWSFIFNKMNHFTNQRNSSTYDEIWLTEHEPIFTIGQTRNMHQQSNAIFLHKNIPVRYSNRGGKITYHGPGQQLIYFLIDLKRCQLSIFNLIEKIKKIIIRTLKFFFIHSIAGIKHPGIYIEDKKISSFGLKIQRGCSLHGCSLNVKMDLTPFNYIYPCGIRNIKMTQISDFIFNISMNQVQNVLIKEISNIFMSKIRIVYGF
ncbi:lipoyl(octanoyl) transferase LipB [Buchnera aphidicola]